MEKILLIGRCTRLHMVCAFAVMFVLSACSHGGQSPQASASVRRSSTPTTSAATVPAAGGVAFATFHGMEPAKFSSTECWLDDINGQSPASAPPVKVGTTVVFRGWAGNGRGQPAEHFDLVLKDAQHSYAAPLTIGVARGDVAQVLKNKAMVNSGYDMATTLAAVAAGTYSLYVANPANSGEDCNLQRTLTVQ